MKSVSFEGYFRHHEYSDFVHEKLPLWISCSGYAAFQEDQRMFHYTDRIAIVLVCRGSMVLEVEGVRHTVPRNGICLLHRKVRERISLVIR